MLENNDSNSCFEESNIWYAVCRLVNSPRVLTQLENLNHRMAGIACSFDYLHGTGAGEVAAAARRFVFNSYFLYSSNSAFGLLAYYHLFGPQRDEVTGEWIKLHNEELNDLYSLPNIVRVVKSRRMRWAGHVARMGEVRGVHRVLVGKSEGKRPLGRPRRRWEDNIKMDLQEVGRGRGDWMELAQDRDRWRALVGMVRDFRIP